MSSCISSSNDISSGNIDPKKFTELSKIIDLLSLTPPFLPLHSEPLPSKIIMIQNDRIAILIDKLLDEFPRVSFHFKCGKIQTTKHQFIESLESLSITNLNKIYVLFDYDRKLSNLV